MMSFLLNEILFDVLFSRRKGHFLGHPSLSNANKNLFQIRRDNLKTSTKTHRRGIKKGTVNLKVELYMMSSNLVMFFYLRPMFDNSLC